MSLARLHQQAQQQRIPTDLPCSLDANTQQRQLIAELESKNRSGMTASVMLFGPLLLLLKRFPERIKRPGLTKYTQSSCITNNCYYCYKRVNKTIYMKFKTEEYSNLFI